MQKCLFQQNNNKIKYMKNIMQYVFLVMSFTLVVLSCTKKENKYRVYSPDKKLHVDLTGKSDTLFLDMNKEQQRLLDPSPLLLMVEDELVLWDILSQKENIEKEQLQMRSGEFSEVKLEYVESQFSLSGKTKSNILINATLLIRAYNNVMTYRFILDLPEKRKVEEISKWLPAEKNGFYFTPNGEYEPNGPLKASELKKKSYTTPVIYQSGNYTLSIHESDLHNYPALSVKSLSIKDGLSLAAGSAIASGEFMLPWRVILYGKNMADLHNLKPVYQSLNEKAEGDFSWVKPGIASWDWRVKGTTFDGFTYKMDTKSLKRYIDFSARNGIQYFLLDDEWSLSDNPLKPIPGLDIQEVINYGNSKNVGVLLYYDLKYMKKRIKEIDFEQVAKTYASWGAKGIKYGFLGKIGSKYTVQEKTMRTEERIQIAARHKLIINFHDGPIPFSGLERTYPNYINREYCHAQIDRRMAFTPGQFVKMACVNLLAGFFDQTNGTYALNKMKDRDKGPRNEFNSTVSAETARFFITYTGHLSVLIDAPEAYEAKSDIFDFIKQLPSSWDESNSVFSSGLTFPGTPNVAIIDAATR
jgi:alpha-glucosidase